MPDNPCDPVNNEEGAWVCSAHRGPLGRRWYLGDPTKRCVYGRLEESEAQVTALTSALRTIANNDLDPKVAWLSGMDCARIAEAALRDAAREATTDA